VESDRVYAFCRSLPNIRTLRFLIGLIGAAALLGFPSEVSVRVDASAPGAELPPSWAYFGYDEANYTDAPHGRQLIRELASLAPGAPPVHIRTHFLLASGNGRPALKWSSTNAYTEDASGQPHYDWTVVDRILDTIVHAGAVPFVEIGFMPEALSTRPAPYATDWVPGAPNKDYFAGWTYPPKDYRKWSDLIFAWVRHSVDRYGERAVRGWDWEVWNEPDIGYWHGTAAEYDQLYDYTAAAVKRAFPSARIGGPASTGPANSKAAAFLRQFLEHCVRGSNAATGQTGAPLDFISFHAKGRPQLTDGRLLMGLAQELKDVAAGFEIVGAFPPFRNLPIVLSEADPEGCAACSARVYPQNAYRNGTLYPAYEAEAWKSLLTLAGTQNRNLAAMLTWAFEFEDQPFFDGFRSLATNGVDKPVLNLFRMTARLHGAAIPALSSAAAVPSDIIAQGVPERSIDAVATRSSHSLAVLLWNYADSEAPAQPETAVSLDLNGLSEGVHRVTVHHYRIDRTHSNAYTAWQRLGSPQNPTPAEYEKLEKSGQLELLTEPATLPVAGGALRIPISLPTESLSLVELTW
jgi:xylan 1,4-beta-xylosidase